MTTYETNHEKSAAAERLAALAAGASGRSKAARLRDLIDDVEAALLAGVTRAAIVRELSSVGLDFTMQTFALTLKRIRKAREGAAVVRAAARPAAIEPPPAAVPVTHDDSAVNRLVTVSATSLPCSPERGPATVSPLPDDWRTAKLTPQQARLLTPDQKKERRVAMEKVYFPSAFDGVSLKTSPTND